MNRRSFLKALGLGSGTSALSGCGILDNNIYYTPIENVLPYVVRPEQVTPGTPTYFATSVGTGPSAYPVLALHREGRVVNVTANRKTPAAPAVPHSALLELQRHFSPDRVKEPMLDGAVSTWDDGLKKLADAVTAARAGGKRVVYLGGYKGGALAQLAKGFTGGNAIHWEPLGRAAEAAAAEKLFGKRALPKYDIAGAHYLVSFGAEFLGGSWGGAWSQAAFAAARNPNADHVVCRFALVSPIRTQTGANCDDWHKATPGSEAQVALAVAKLVAQKKGYAGPAASMLNGADVAKAAAASGLDEAAITAIAEKFAAAPAIALPGGVAGASAAATELAAAVMLLNIVSGHGLMTNGGFAGPMHGNDAIDELVEAMKGGKVGVLLVDDVDPVHNTPGNAFAEAMGSVDLTVSVSSHPDETSGACKLVLPASDSFEDWGHEEPMAGFHIVRQPAQTPLWNSRSLGDILLATWRATNPGTAPQGNWMEYIQTAFAGVIAGAAAPEDEPAEGDAPEGGEEAGAKAAPEPAAEEAPRVTFAAIERAWTDALMNGAHVADSHSSVPRVTGSMTFSDAPAGAGSGEYFLLAYEHNILGDGRFANQPWAQEAPEPMTGQVWDSFVILHPDTAGKLGVGDNDLVNLTTDAGTIEIGVEVQPFVRPDVVAVAIGQGHSAKAGRYAEAIGINVLDLLANTVDAGGAFAWQQAKVAVSSAGRQAELVSTMGHDHDEDRNWAALCNAESFAKEGDKEQHHGGELTGIHHLPMDGRLQEAGITGFYPDPDHPTYRFAMTVDTDACTGCGACSIACYAENNLPVVGKRKVGEGREMGWVRVNRYVKGDDIHFVPLMCQQCGHAPCESVCPVLATYHTIDGLNAMIYNRCVGTRYCANACPYSARKFNYHSYVWPEPFNLQLNPDVVARTMGVMEKCTFCVQRIRRVKSAYKDAHGFTAVVPDEALAQLPACADACPSQAITFGNTEDPKSGPTKLRKSGRNYIPIAEINTYPAVNYLAKATFHADPAAGHGGGHGGDHADGGEHGDDSHGGAEGKKHDDHNDDHKPATEAGGH